MSNKEITDLPVETSISPEMLIPTGGFGDISINVAQLREFAYTLPSTYQTTNPNLKIKNGSSQILNISSTNKLTADLRSGQYLYVRVIGSAPLDLSDFTIVNNYVKSGESCFILIINILGENILIGANFTETSVPDPLRGSQ